MRARIVARVRKGDSGLEPIAEAAVRSLIEAAGAP
jgi:hypothetical protein